MGTIHHLHGVTCIVSGGQTGVDQAALDAAIELGIQHGGWCPLGRLSEDGRIPSKYHLTELSTPDYVNRTQQNVIDSDGTLILYMRKLQGGTALTARFARELAKPLFRAKLGTVIDFGEVVDWLKKNRIHRLNVAGPRASSHPDIHRAAKKFLVDLSKFDASTRQTLFE